MNVKVTGPSLVQILEYLNSGPKMTFEGNLANFTLVLASYILAGVQFK